MAVLPERTCPSVILPDQNKVNAVTDFKIPFNVKQVKQLLGLTSYYCQFIHYACHVEPLFALTKNYLPFIWNGACQDAMDLLKGKLTSKFPWFCSPFLYSYRCLRHGTWSLMQRDQHSRDVAMAYASRALHKLEKPYSTPKKECLAIIRALE